MKKCINCGKYLSGLQQKFCSNACKQKNHYWKVKNQRNTYHAQTIRAYRRKLMLVFSKGGKCESCGYSKNLAALEFHHKSGKELKLGSRMLSNTRFERLLNEVQKCSLLCANCHREHHHPESETSNVFNLIGDSMEKSMDANRMNSVKPLAMATLSQALKAFKEGAETTG